MRRLWETAVGLGLGLGLGLWLGWAGLGVGLVMIGIDLIASKYTKGQDRPAWCYVLLPPVSLPSCSSMLYVPPTVDIITPPFKQDTSRLRSSSWGGGGDVLFCHAGCNRVLHAASPQPSGSGMLWRCVRVAQVAYWNKFALTVDPPVDKAAVAPARSAHYRTELGRRSGGKSDRTGSQGWECPWYLGPSSHTHMGAYFVSASLTPAGCYCVHLGAASTLWFAMRATSRHNIDTGGTGPACLSLEKPPPHLDPCELPAPGTSDTSVSLGTVGVVSWDTSIIVTPSLTTAIWLWGAAATHLWGRLPTRPPSLWTPKPPWRQRGRHGTDRNWAGAAVERRASSWCIIARSWHARRPSAPLLRDGHARVFEPKFYAHSSSADPVPPTPAGAINQILPE
ncbi:hypothetical protein B0H13DRAFT_1858740 [Mycena leptocephala]|nr:hypothetical protein B0H13DRAFT_1858740 [Mycena leptocephala]